MNQPKGIEIVKESINKLKLIKPLKKSEGAKIPKVELTISVNGVAIQEPKSKKIYCQFPLHRISYCADDKTEKKFFSFIAKDIDTDKHLCFVFMSDKLSEEIILTIGQAFDLAYAKFIETSGRELEIRKQLIILQKRVCDLEEENKSLKNRLGKYEPVIKEEEETSTATATMLLLEAEATTATSTKPVENGTAGNGFESGSGSKQSNGYKVAKIVNTVPVPAIQPPPSVKNRASINNTTTSSNNNHLVNLLDVDIEYDSTAPVVKLPQPVGGGGSGDLFDEDFDPRAGDEKGDNGIGSSIDITQEKDIFGCEPFQIQQDPFGMGQFATTTDLDSAIVNIDRKLAEMRVCLFRNLYPLP